MKRISVPTLLAAVSCSLLLGTFCIRPTDSTGLILLITGPVALASIIWDLFHD